MDILRFLTAGSVDDGKSTLIGRLLHDSKSILIDQLEALKKQSKNVEDGDIDLALITDGLRAEREQGITIDVAYKYFSTPVRKFIIADAPGHIQYTRNMVTGASNADLVIIMIDARYGIVEQTNRHSIITSILGIHHVVVAINKMDLVEYSEDIYSNIVIDYAKIAAKLGLRDVTYIPVSALRGDNIVEKSGNMPWYKGESLLHYLEKIEVQKDVNLDLARFPVQYVICPQAKELHDYRGYAGRINSGVYRKGDNVTILPSGIKTTLKKIEINNCEVEEAVAMQSVIFQLTDDIDISRGDVIVKSNNLPMLGKDLEALICWMGNTALIPGNRYLLQINSLLIRIVVKDISYQIDVNTLKRHPAPGKADLNEIVKASIRTATPLPYDSYKQLKSGGSAILIDETSNATVGACMIQ